MNVYAIHDDEGTFLFEMVGDSQDEVLAEAKRYNRSSYRAIFMERVPSH